MLGRHLIKSWSSTQTSIALSSGEAEFYGVVKAGGVSLGFQSLLADVGLKLPVRVWTDSSATLGICGRQGLGRLRHIDTQCLWIQQRVRDGAVQLYKVRGEENPADLFTKHLVCRDRIQSLLRLFGCSYRDGRAATAPRVRADAGTSKGELLRLEAAGVDLIEHDGRQFPTVECDGERWWRLCRCARTSCLTCTRTWRRDSPERERAKRWRMTTPSRTTVSKLAGCIWGSN